MANEDIISIVDYHLQKWMGAEGNKLPTEIDSLMADPDQNPKEEWRTWFPINSRVTDSEISEFEDRIGHVLPADYITFLKHKHFYELNISEASFCEHPVFTWRKSLSEMIFDGYPKEFLIERGLIPFANWSDWGHLCFDTSGKNSDHNYPIVIWDHEIPYDNQFFASDFKTSMIKLDKQDRESCGDKE